uniref:HTH tetR-type domain-containing protein n=1 Tax=Arthrobacter sp. JS443 TaxID=416011 RepID=A7YVV5_9MICC|nr:hypothetical protein [Arthrobacter sp. JS443]
MAWNTERTKLLLLAAATHEFSDKGFAGARVDRIAKNAGVNKERIYEYYGSKCGLFDAALADLFPHDLEVPLDAGGLGSFVGQLFDRYCEDDTAARLLLWEALEAAPGAVETGPSIRWWTRQVDRLLVAIPGTDRASAADILLTIVTLCACWPVIQLRESIPSRERAGRDAARRASVVSTVLLAVQPLIDSGTA